MLDPSLLLSTALSYTLARLPPKSDQAENGKTAPTCQIPRQAALSSEYV